MSTFDAAQNAGEVLRQLIRENYATQQDFADEYSMDIRTVNRYINDGSNKVATIQWLAELFNVDIIRFFTPVE